MQQWDYTHILVCIPPGHIGEWRIYSSVSALNAKGSGDFYSILFQMGESGWEIMNLYERMRDTDGATVISFWLKRSKQTQIALPVLSDLERRVVNYIMTDLGNRFVLRKVHKAFKDEVTYAELRALSNAWKKQHLLTGNRPYKLSAEIITLCQNT